MNTLNYRLFSIFVNQINSSLRKITCILFLFLISKVISAQSFSTEISEAIDFANFYSYSAKDFGPSTPLGTVLVVPPWNFPYAIPMGGVCAALAAGNTVILKPAPETVATAYEAASQLWDGGVPKEVLQFLPMRDDESARRTP